MSIAHHQVDLMTNHLLAKGKIKTEYRASHNKMRWPLHAHSGYEIYFFHKGQATYLINNYVYDLEPGDMLIFNGEYLHQVNPGKGEYIRTYINFHLHYLENILSKHIYENMIHLFESRNGILIRWSMEELIQLEQICSQIEEENLKEEVGHDSMIHTYLSQLLIRIYRKIKGVHINVENNQKKNHVHKILEYINENYMNEINLDLISEAVHLNKYYMSHCFKEITGFTINKYLAQRRIEEAKKLLLSTEKSINQISAEIGLSSPGQLSRLFKQYENMSPQEFRTRGLSAEHDLYH